ncbi:hypothetical protein [Deinococcus koreensis]|uniref:Uncharacterized protein n=1 Tax=Deinococcus koreensis TaxID=2054903 RepID=A0A2K3UZX4_9DEIO|nr:hypothetical protein [Deinococcus koreensis]PNY82081.1 hypothetical protein CVO96_12525 [Deinococcus koreensis]
MSSPELLREALRELLYGPEGLRGLYSEAGAGLLATVHAYTYAQAAQPPAPGRPTPAQLTLQLQQALELGAARLADPHALLSDPRDPEQWRPEHEGDWRAELVALARAGEAFYGALYLPLDAGGWREAQGTLLQAVTLAGALRFHLLNLRAG